MIDILINDIKIMKVQKHRYHYVSHLQLKFKILDVAHSHLIEHFIIRDAYQYIDMSFLGS